MELVSLKHFHANPSTYARYARYATHARRCGPAQPFPEFHSDKLLFQLSRRRTYLWANPPLFELLTQGSSNSCAKCDQQSTAINMLHNMYYTAVQENLRWHRMAAGDGAAAARAPETEGYEAVAEEAAATDEAAAAAAAAVAVAVPVLEHEKSPPSIFCTGSCRLLHACGSWPLRLGGQVRQWLGSILLRLFMTPDDFLLLPITFYYILRLLPITTFLLHLMPPAPAYTFSKYTQQDSPAVSRGLLFYSPTTIPSATLRACMGWTLRHAHTNLGPTFWGSCTPRVSTG